MLVRGHNRDYVEGIVRELHVSLKKHDRKLSLSDSNMAFIILVLFLFGQFFFYNSVPLNFNGFLGYLLIIIVSIIPTLILLGVAQGIRTLIPQIELTTQEGNTRWRRSRKKVYAVATGLFTIIAVPIILALIKHKLGLSS